jgi:FMN phosphatase YigB (HAD superfamily)
VVSNICAPPSACAAHFHAQGLGSVFAHATFSSGGRSIKPSARIFQAALAKCRPGARVLFVGDSMERDILPARRLGLRTAWIRSPTTCSTESDVVIDNLTELGAVSI